MRAVIRLVLRMILRIFFPALEISGAERVPSHGPVILAVNHPNGLIDPAFLLCLAERPVSFLAKAPLFDMPVIGWFVRALGSIPVYRRQDGGFDPSKNRQTFERARSILSGGGVIAIFPEGASHGDPKLRPLKTGAARIALGVASASASDERVKIVPAGIYYTARGIFRSAALLYFGKPLTVSPVAPDDEDGEPPADAVRGLTNRLRDALADVTIQADEHDALALVERAENVFSSEDPTDDSRLVDKFELRRRLMAGYTRLRNEAPERLANISDRINQYETELRKAGLDPDTLRPARGRPSDVLVDLAKFLGLVVTMPLVLIGLIINYPVYRLVGFITDRVTRDDEGMLATVKLLAGALLFPVMWLLVSVIIGIRFGLLAGLVALIAAPVTGYLALRVFESLDDSIAGLRAAVMSRFRRWGYLRLVAERRAIHVEIVNLATEFED